MKNNILLYKIALVIIFLTSSLNLKSQNWSLLPFNSMGFPSCSLIQSNNSMLYINNYSYGIFYSTDFGESWIISSSDFNQESINSIIFKDSIGYACSNLRISKSIDYGLNWNTTNFKDLFIDYFDLSIKTAFISDTTLFISASNGVFKSTYGIDNWTKVTNGLPMTVRHFAKLKSNIYAFSLGIGLHKSTDLGNTWTNIGLDKVFCTAMQTNNNSIFIGTENGLFISNDEGVTWNQTDTTTNKFKNIRCIETVGNIIYIGTSNGVYKSKDNGLTWSEFGLQGSQVLAIHSMDKYLFASNSLIYKLDLTTDISSDGFNSENKISTFPNPASDYVTIKIQSSNSLRNNITLKTLTSDIVFSTSTTNEEYKINTKNIPNGVYILTIDNSINLYSSLITIVK